MRRRDEKNGHTLLLELTTKEIARSEGSRVCKQGGSQGVTRLCVCVACKPSKRVQWTNTAQQRSDNSSITLPP